MNLSGFAGYNSGDRITTANGNFQWRDDFTKVLGSHTLKFGAQITRSRKNEDTNVRDEGNVTFNTSALLTSQNVIADALLGNFQSYTETEADTFWWARFSQYEFYAQDSWKASKRLTSSSACGITSFHRSTTRRGTPPPGFLAFSIRRMRRK